MLIKQTQMLEHMREGNLSALHMRLLCEYLTKLVNGKEERNGVHSQCNIFINGVKKCEERSTAVAIRLRRVKYVKKE